MTKAIWYRLVGVVLLAMIVVVGVRTCQQSDPLRSIAEGNDVPDDPNQTGLTFRAVTLEQPDENGKKLWTVKGTEVTYSPDRQIAFVTAPDGELYQDGVIIYRVKAETGEIRENGKVIFLWGNIVATGVESGAVLRGNELEWRPDEDRLIVRNRLTGSHPQIQALAQQAEVFNREKRILLTGDVEANTVVEDPAQEPWLKLQTQQLEWFWGNEFLASEEPLRVEQFKLNQITEFVTSQQGQVDLAANVVTLNQDVEMQLLEFPLQVTSQEMVWRVDDDQVQVNQPLRMVEPEQQVVVTANQGVMDLEQELVVLTQNVNAQGQRNQSQLMSDLLTWNIPQQTVVAEGNVDYQQVDPEFHLKGPRAFGQLEDQRIVVSGGRVVTEIVPNQTRRVAKQSSNASVHSTVAP